MPSNLFVATIVLLRTGASCGLHNFMTLINFNNLQYAPVT